MARSMGVQQKILNGYGVIDLKHPEQYKPWIQTKEVTNGSGRRRIIPDIYYPERMIHLMSNLEKDVYYLLRKDEHVLELFEQVPLDLNITLRICDELGIRHPHEPFTANNIVMTTDFVVYVDIGGKREFHAFAVKPSSALKDERVMEKLIVEQRYWREQNVTWRIIDETAQNKR